MAGGGISVFEGYCPIVARVHLVVIYYICYFRGFAGDDSLEEET